MDGQDFINVRYGGKLGIKLLDIFVAIAKLFLLQHVGRQEKENKNKEIIRNRDYSLEELNDKLDSMNGLIEQYQKEVSQNEVAMLKNTFYIIDARLHQKEPHP